MSDITTKQWGDYVIDKLRLYFSPERVDGAFVALGVETVNAVLVWDWQNAPERLRSLHHDAMERPTAVAWIPRDASVNRIALELLDGSKGLYAYEMDNGIVIVAVNE